MCYVHSMAKFKCGDRVLIVSDDDDDVFVGRQATIISTWEQGRYNIAVLVDDQPASSTYYYRASNLRGVK